MAYISWILGLTTLIIHSGLYKYGILKQNIKPFEVDNMLYITHQYACDKKTQTQYAKSIPHTSSSNLQVNKMQIINDTVVLRQFITQ
jgi:hypothetical protein